MWTLKFRNKHDDCILAPKCIKLNITDFVHLINSWVEKDFFYYTELHILQGKEENKHKFVRELKKDKLTKRLEQKGNYIFTLNKRKHIEKSYSSVFDHRLIMTKPAVQRADGFEDWNIACWDKQPLMNVLQVPTFKTKIISFKQEKIEDIFLPQIYPKLSPKQKEAIELAVNKGYYEYPRNIDLERLSQIKKVKRQTFNENLRRAEKKLIPFLTENIN